MRRLRQVCRPRRTSRDLAHWCPMCHNSRHTGCFATFVRILGKCDTLMQDLELVLADIRDIYSAGAVEGYNEQYHDYTIIGVQDFNVVLFP